MFSQHRNKEANKQEASYLSNINTGCILCSLSAGGGAESAVYVLHEGGVGSADMNDE